MSWLRSGVGGSTRSAASASGQRISCGPGTGLRSSGSTRSWRRRRERYGNYPECLRYVPSSRSVHPGNPSAMNLSAWPAARPGLKGSRYSIRYRVLFVRA